MPNYGVTPAMLDAIRDKDAATALHKKEEKRVCDALPELEARIVALEA